MKYKLVALDIDGTLINDNLDIPQENIDTIKLLQDKGVEFILISGRAAPLTYQYAEILNMKGPVIGNNGAVTMNRSTNEIIDIHHFDHNILKNIYSFFRSMDLYPRLYSLDTFYTFNQDKIKVENDFLIEYTKMTSEFMEFKYLNHIDDLINDDAKILNLFYPSTDPDKLIEIQEGLNKIKGIEAVKSTSYLVDILKDDVSKASALLKYADSLGISKDEIIAIGDNENDIHMLSVVGLPITLENGKDNVKEIAHMVFPSNNDAGVAKALKKVFNLD